MTTTDKPVTFRNDQGRIHAEARENRTYCGRDKTARNGYRVMNRPATVTCGRCHDVMTETALVVAVDNGMITLELSPEAAERIQRGQISGMSITGASGAVWPL